MPGNSSNTVVIRTNATQFGPGTINFIDSATANVVGFGPLVPEPQSLLLLAAGIPFLAGRRFRRH